VNIIITERTRRGVAFLSMKGSRGLQPTGTAFFIDIQWGDWRHWLTYAVTAQHCINGIKGSVYLDFADSNGEARTVETKADEWDKSTTTDVACRLLSPDECQGLVKIHQAQAFQSDIGLLGAGYEVYIIGLFSSSPYHARTQAAEPIVRFGRIARPRATAPVYFDISDRGKKDKQTLVNAILIESFSTGGESGSPVFICEGYVRDADPYSPPPFGPRRTLLTDNDVPTSLLGLVSAHWSIPTPTKVKRGKSANEIELNSGIAVVIPVADILKFILDDERVNQRRQHIEKGESTQPTTPLSNQSRGAQTFAKKGFENCAAKG
jgi:hypothetical protein